MGRRRNQEMESLAEDCSLSDESVSEFDNGLKRYWVGLTKDCPFSTLEVRGQEFTYQTEIVEFDAKTGQTQRTKQLGRYVELDERRVEEITRAATEDKLIRLEGARPIKKSKKSARFRASRNDVPFAKYMYLVEIPEQGLPRDRVPQTLV